MFYILKVFQFHDEEDQYAGLHVQLLLHSFQSQGEEPRELLDVVVQRLKL
jgi:hypothetical protein